MFFQKGSGRFHCLEKVAKVPLIFSYFVVSVVLGWPVDLYICFTGAIYWEGLGLDFEKDVPIKLLEGTILSWNGLGASRRTRTCVTRKVSYR